MEDTLVIGIGGFGSQVVDRFCENLSKINSRSRDGIIKCMVMDIDPRDLNEIKAADPIFLGEASSLGTVIDRLPPELVKEIFGDAFYEDREFAHFLKTHEMTNTALSRQKAYLAFLNFLNDPMRCSQWEYKLRDFVAECGDYSHYRVYIVASLAGATGSALCLPLSCYLTKFLKIRTRREPEIVPMLISPEIYANQSVDPATTIRFRGNAYAAMREWNAVVAAEDRNNRSPNSSDQRPISFRFGFFDDRHSGEAFDNLFNSETTNEVRVEKIGLFQCDPCLSSITEYTEAAASWLALWIDHYYNRSCWRDGMHIVRREKRSLLPTVAHRVKRFAVEKEKLPRYFALRYIDEEILEPKRLVHQALLDDLEKTNGDHAAAIVLNTDQRNWLYKAACGYIAREIEGFQHKLIRLIRQSPSLAALEMIELEEAPDFSRLWFHNRKAKAYCEFAERIHSIRRYADGAFNETVGHLYNTLRDAAREFIGYDDSPGSFYKALYDRKIGMDNPEYGWFQIDPPKYYQAIAMMVIELQDCIKRFSKSKAILKEACDNAALPDSFFTREPLKEKGFYAESDRLCRAFDYAEDKTAHPKQDFSLFCQDALAISQAFTTLMSEAMAALLAERMVTYLQSLLEQYDKTSYDITSAPFWRSSIERSEEDESYLPQYSERRLTKEAKKEYYRQFYRKEAPIYATQDDIELRFWSCAFSSMKENTENSADYLDVCYKIAAVVTKEVEKSQFVKKLKETSVFETMMKEHLAVGRTPDEAVDAIAKELLACFQAQESKSPGKSFERHLIISPESAAYLYHEEAFRADRSGDSPFFKTYVAQASSFARDDEILFLLEERDYDYYLPQPIAFFEFGKADLYYRSYAECRARIHESPLWARSLLARCAVSHDLPLIHPDGEAWYLATAAKAFLYLLSEGIIKAETPPHLRERIKSGELYIMEENQKPQILFFNEAPIAEDHPEQVFFWLYDREDLVERYSQQFERVYGLANHEEKWQDHLSWMRGVYARLVNRSLLPSGDEFVNRLMNGAPFAFLEKDELSEELKQIFSS